MSETDVEPQTPTGLEPDPAAPAERPPVPPWALGLVARIAREGRQHRSLGRRSGREPKTEAELDRKSAAESKRQRRWDRNLANR